MSVKGAEWTQLLAKFYLQICCERDHCVFFSHVLFCVLLALSPCPAGTIHDIINRGGRCLIPVFALGRAQELLLILGKIWHDVCSASTVSKLC